MTVTRTAPIALWRIAQAFLDVLYNLFGNPEDVAFRHTLTKKPYALLREWLRAGEALMRKLLLIEAAAFPKPNTRPLLRVSRKRIRKLRYFQDEKPEEWRVSFRCFVGARASRRRMGRPEENPPARHRRSTGFFSAWPLAERYEALLRAFENPAPYAARLAKRLYAQPHLARVVLTHPESAGPLVGSVAFGELTTHSETERKRAFPDSS